MSKHFKYILVIATTIGSYLGASTTLYTPGSELANGTRSDTIRIGSAGGFGGYTNPASNRCKTLYVTFSTSGTPAANITLTNAYNGDGTIPHIPATVDDIWLQGDARGFDTLVSGGLKYALPTPNVKTTIHFLLTNAPATSPLGWFQGPLPADCRVVIERGSADPFINSVLPMAGGSIIIGAPITPAAGFSHLLSTMSKPCTIQRHPLVNVTNAYSQAVMTLPEATTFPGVVSGISLAGDYRATFNDFSALVDPTSGSGDAGYTVASAKTVTLYGSHGTLPGIRSTLSAGGTANVRVATAAPALPTLTPPLIAHL